MNKYAKITLGACLLFVFGLFYVLIVEPSKDSSNSSEKLNESQFYGKVVELSGDAADRYPSGINMIRYVPCQRDGSGEFSHVSDEIKRLYSRPALVSYLFHHQARVGDVVMIYHKVYKASSKANELVDGRYTNISIALPLGTEPMPGM